MRKRLNLDKTQDQLAEDMWGEIIQKRKILNGLIEYRCKDYRGYIFNDRDFNIDHKLKVKLTPMIVLETYRYRDEKFILEMTKEQESIPHKLHSKIKYRKYEEQVNVYALTDQFMMVLQYYHREVLKTIYDHKLEEMTKRYKSFSGYMNRKKKDIMGYLALNGPEYVKKKDQKIAKKYIEQAMEEIINMKLQENKKTSDDVIEIIEDCFIQKTELLCR